MKTLARKQLEAREAQTVRIARNVLGDDDKGDDIEDEPLEAYAEHGHIRISNPKGVSHMAAPTRQQLLDRVAELETENEDLQSRLDEIADIIGDSDEEEDTDEGEDNDQGED